MTISRSTLAVIDSSRGTTPRSRFIESVLKTQTGERAVSREHLRRHGIVYTPHTLADFVAQKVIGYAFEESSYPAMAKFSSARIGLGFRQIRILDPGCGNGELLEAAWHHLIEHQVRARGEKTGKRVDPRVVLCGMDTDADAARGTRVRIQALAVGAGFTRRCACKVLNTNALFPYGCRRSAQGWARAKREFDAPRGFDIVIANPPWGADVSEYRDRLSQDEFSLFQGQYDSSDLFIEMALSVVKPGGLIAFIIPDSLFNYERRYLRRLLVEKTHICFLGRFGERIFEGIHRACAVVVCRKVMASPRAEVDCLRLTPESRKRILSGVSAFRDEERRLGYSVLQSRFQANPYCAFDIDVSTKEEVTLRCFTGHKSCFGDYLKGTRGVELSKRGRVCQCTACGKWFPLPMARGAACPHCRCQPDGAEDRVVSIVQDKKSKGSVPLIVGESVGRYTLRQSLWIASDCPGINYKRMATYAPPKLLVRKTGIGISATMDYSHAFTNQVVYIFREKEDDHQQVLPLEFFLGVLNSRAVYYFLTKRYGETEWRSHPYVTQRQILALPLPEHKTLEKKREMAQEVARLLRPHVRRGSEPPVAVDAAVERLVAGLYGLTKAHYKVIYATLESVQELLPVRMLKRVRLGDIFGL